MKQIVDIYTCHGCGRAVITEENEEPVICPYISCESDDLEYSHSSELENK